MTTTSSRARQCLAHPLAVGERMHRVARLDQHGAVAVGMIAEDLVGDDIARHQPGDETMTRDRRAWFGIVGTAVGATAEQRHEVRVEVHAARNPEVAGQQDDELLQVAVERRVRRHLDAEVFVDRDAAGGLADGARCGTNDGFVDAGAIARLGDVDHPQVSDDLVETVGVVGQPPVGQHVLLDEYRQDRGEEMRVTTGPGPQVDVGQISRFGAARIDDDQGPRRIVGDLLEDLARLRKAM